MLTVSAHDVTYLVQLFLYHTSVGSEIIVALNRCCSKSTSAPAVTLKWIPGSVFSCVEKMKIGVRRSGYEEIMNHIIVLHYQRPSLWMTIISNTRYVIKHIS